LVVAEDIQWFDASTIEVLGSLLATDGGRVLIALTGRDGGRLPPCWPAPLPQRAQSRPIRIGI